MPRRKPFSAKQKKEQLKDKRAVKRGELDASEVRIASQAHRAARPGNLIQSRRGPSGAGPSGLGTTRLQSKFTALTPEYLDRTRDLAHSVPLPRPLPDENAVFPVEWMERDEGRLTCPARPKFRYDQTKKEVERNEEGVFERWVKGTKGFVKAWVEDEPDRGRNRDGGSKDGAVGGAGEGEREDPHEEEITEEKRWENLRSPTWFETNLEVWRQLWRVTESSQILLLLADARCPPLHLPPSLRTYVQALKPRKEVILVLTKSDLVDPAALEGWKGWVRVWWAKGYKAKETGIVEGESRSRQKQQQYEGEGMEVQVVAVHSYDTVALYSDKPRHRPDLPASSLHELLDALQAAHTRLKTPPERVRTDPERLKNWRSPVRSAVDWELLAKGPASAYPPADVAQVSGSHSDERPALALEDQRTRMETDGPELESERDPEKEPLTIGLIGQPNVGKSSLLNAILGESRVRASRTPGKTKHFQTLFWGWKKDVKIVDCPGLVCPSLVGLEIQALCGILPISQIPSLSACMLSAAHLLPLEQIFRVSAMPTEIDEYVDKRTWRTPREGDAAAEEKKERWTAGGIMEARALDRGYLTAKGGRPDGNRAANGMMRSLADGKVRWCFFPPGSTSDRAGKGIWLGDYAAEEENDKDDVESAIGTDDEVIGHRIAEKRQRNGSAGEDGRDDDGDEDGDDIASSDDDGEASEVEKRAREIDRGFFAALEMDDDDDEDEDSDEDDEEEEDEDDSQEKVKEG